MYSKKSEVNSSCEPESADLNTNLCRKGKVCSRVSGNLSLAFPTLCVRPLTCLASCLAQGVCSSGRREKGLRKGTVPLSWPLSSPPLSPLSTPSRSPKKVLLILLMLQQRCPSCSFRANSWALTWGALCFALIVMPQPVTVMGKGQALRQTGAEYHNFSLLFDTLTFGKCRKRRMNKTTTYDRTAQRNLC